MSAPPRGTTRCTAIAGTPRLPTTSSTATCPGEVAIAWTGNGSAATGRSAATALDLVEH